MVKVWICKWEMLLHWFPVIMRLVPGLGYRCSAAAELRDRQLQCLFNSHKKSRSCEHASGTLPLFWFVCFNSLAIFSCRIPQLWRKAGVCGPPGAQPRPLTSCPELVGPAAPPVAHSETMACERQVGRPGVLTGLPVLLPLLWSLAAPVKRRSKGRCVVVWSCQLPLSSLSANRLQQRADG